jgi:GTPase SAR1 family protein
MGKKIKAKYIEPIRSTYKVNIAVCGQVSSGKSTAINAILGQYFSETSMKRTTKKVYTFSHSDDKTTFTNDIKSEIEKHNSLGDVNIEFVVNIPFVNKNSLLCAIKDYPGFNDGKEDIAGMENLFYTDLPNIDYVMYILDATCPLIHKSEKDLILSIFDKIKQNHQNNKYTRIAFIFNKVDDN